MFQNEVWLALLAVAEKRHPFYAQAVQQAMEISLDRVKEYAGDETPDPFANFLFRAHLHQLIAQLRGETVPTLSRATMDVFMGDVILKLSRLIVNIGDMDGERALDSAIDGANYFLLLAAYLLRDNSGQEKENKPDEDF